MRSVVRMQAPAPDDVDDDVIILDVLDRVADWTSADKRRRHDASERRNFCYRDNRERRRSLR